MCPSRDATSFSMFGMAVVFEAGLGVIGALIAWVAGISLLELVWPAPQVAAAVASGVAATLPLLLMLAVLSLCTWRPVARLRRLVGRFVGKLFRHAPLWQLAVVSLAAGVGEEVLFRGAIQPLAVTYTSPLVGLAIASVLFGAVHAATPAYFWLATGVGVYLGALTLMRGEILSAIVVHALYDFVALTCISRGWLPRPRPLFELR